VVTPALDIVDVSVSYRHDGHEIPVLQGASLTVQPGELVAIIGPRRSGKSAMISCAAGLAEPGSGQVRVAGTRLDHLTDTERAAFRALHIGLLTQSGLDDAISVRRNVDQAQHIAGRLDPEWREAMFNLMFLTEHASRRPGGLTGGNAVRSRLAVALATRPGLVLADEPIGEQEHAAQRGLLDLLRLQTDHGAAVVIASRSSAALRVADRVVELRERTPVRA
jgi:ABC-type lipoprotein export system ATPase subunit